MKGQSEILGALVLAMIVLGALTWLLAQWQQGVGEAVKEINKVTEQTEKLNIRIDCTGNYLVFINPSGPSVTDASTTIYSKLSYCYAELVDKSYKAYIVTPFTCSGYPSAYVIYGSFVQTVVNGVTLYQFRPYNSTAIVPLASCTNIAFSPFATLHILFPDGTEKVAVCFLNTTKLSTGTAWGVTSCVGA